MTIYADLYSLSFGVTHHDMLEVLGSLTCHPPCREGWIPWWQHFSIDACNASLFQETLNQLRGDKSELGERRIMKGREQAADPVQGVKASGAAQPVQYCTLSTSSSQSRGRSDLDASRCDSGRLSDEFPARNHEGGT